MGEKRSVQEAMTLLETELDLLKTKISEVGQE